MQKFVFEVDPNEMVLRMLEALLGMQRPNDRTAAEAVADARRANPELVNQLLKVAAVAGQYMAEVITTQEAQAKVQ